MEFHANVPADGFKAFSSTLDLFAQLGEIVCIDVRSNQFIMSALNNSRTAQGLARFGPNFFDDYKLLRRNSPETSMQCTVSNKNLNSIFKRNIASSEIISMCQITITQGSVDQEQYVESRIRMKLVYTNGVTKTNSICYTDGDRIAPLYTAEQMHHFALSPSSLKSCFVRFDPKVTDVVFECTPYRIGVRSYWDENLSSGNRPVQSSYAIDSTDCYEYSIIEPIKIVCSLREFKAMIEFTEIVEGTLRVSLESVGQPIIFKYLENVNIKLSLIIMTQSDNSDYSNNLSMDDFTMTSIASSDIPMGNQTPPPAPSRSNNRRDPPVSPSRSNNRCAPPSSPARPARTPADSSSIKMTTSEEPPSLVRRKNTSNRRIAETRNTTNNPPVDSGTNSTIHIGSMPSVRATDVEEEEEEPLFNRKPTGRRRMEIGEESSSTGNSSRRRSNISSNANQQRLTTLEKLRIKKQQQKQPSSSKESSHNVGGAGSPVLNMAQPNFNASSTGSGTRVRNSMPFDSGDSDATKPAVYSIDDDSDDEHAMETSPPSSKKQRRHLAQ